MFDDYVNSIKRHRSRDAFKRQHHLHTSHRFEDDDKEEDQFDHQENPFDQDEDFEDFQSLNFKHHKARNDDKNYIISSKFDKLPAEEGTEIGKETESKTTATTTKATKEKTSIKIKPTTSTTRSTPEKPKTTTTTSTTVKTTTPKKATTGKKVQKSSRLHALLSK